MLKAPILSVPACMLVAGSALLSFRSKSVPSLLQLLGAGCLMVVVLTHVAEALVRRWRASEPSTFAAR
jgi:hypothetical protein